MNNQEILDKVIAHARKQNCKAITSIGLCKYRTDDGLKCFVGAFIPDELYNPRLEGIIPDLSYLDVSQVHFNKILNDCGIANEQFSFLCDLQSVHDFFEENKWENELAKFAELNGLVYTKPEQVEISQ